MADQFKTHQKAEEKTEEYKPKELSKEPTKMQLEQDLQYGNWFYWRDPWLYGPGVERNGTLPLNSTKEEAEAYVNRMYPGSFPEPEKKELDPKAHATHSAAPAKTG
jgi:hypothetical protein